MDSINNFELQKKNYVFYNYLWTTNIILNMDQSLMEKKIKCNDGMSKNTMKLGLIKDEIQKKNLLTKGYKFIYNSIKCELIYLGVNNVGLLLYAYINISIDDNIIEKLNLPNKINYNNKLWIGLFIEKISDLKLDDIILDDEKYLNQEDCFKLPSYGVMICMSIINSYLHASKYV